MRRGPLSFLAALLFLGAGSAWLLHRRAAAKADLRVLLLDPVPGEGVKQLEAQALELLLEDELELRGGLPVTNLPRLPEELGPFPPGARILVLAPQARRQGDALQLTVHWAEAQAGSASALAWKEAASRTQAPARALEEALGALPLDLAPTPAALVPQDPAAFWSLLRAHGAAFSNADLPEALTLARRVADLEPGCATVHFALAQLEDHQMLQAPRGSEIREDQVEAECRRGLELLPEHPRGLRQFCRLKSDAGRQREALPLLQGALQRRPRALNLLFGLDYAARTAGLMDLALAARERIEALWAGQPLATPYAYTYLYAGQLQRFEDSFWQSKGFEPDGRVLFETGYAELAKGHREGALELFDRAEREPGTPEHFRLLAQAMRLQLEGRPAEARAAMGALDQARTGLQVPDGEFTFTMAEAAAFLEDHGLAMDLAHRAFSQGFGCTTWYERSPFLRPLQELPRWKALLQHLREREGRQAALFRRRDFGL